MILFVTKPDDLWVTSEAVLPEPRSLKTVISSVTNLSEPWIPVESVLPEPFESLSEKLMILGDPENSRTATAPISPKG